MSGKKGLESRLVDVTSVDTVVTCKICKRRFSVSDEKEAHGFLVIYGDIRIGLEGQLIHGNIDDKGKLIGSTVCCREKTCVLKVFGNTLGHAVARSTSEETVEKKEKKEKK